MAGSSVAQHQKCEVARKILEAASIAIVHYYDLKLRSWQNEAKMINLFKWRGRCPAGTSCSLPTGRRRLLSTASFLAGKKRRPIPARRARISRSPPAGRPSAACSPKPAMEPVPFWLYYFYVGDIDVAIKRV